MTMYFEPDRARLFPAITEVEMLLGGIPRAIFPDGTLQFMDQDQCPVAVYSPRLVEDSLEEFCRNNMEHYLAYYAKYEKLIEAFEPAPPIEPFWQLTDSPK